MPCQGHLLQLRQRDRELGDRNVRVVVVTFEAGYLARSYAEDTGLLWPLLVDDTRRVYNAYGMLNASFWEIWGPATWRAYLKEMARGRFPKKSAGDVSQRGGNVLIDPSGIVRMHHIGKGPADRPAVAAILSNMTG